MLRVTYEVMCDGCLDVEHLDAGAVTGKQIRDAAKNAGWTRRKLGGNLVDLCADCTKKTNHALSRAPHLGTY